MTEAERHHLVAELMRVRLGWKSPRSCAATVATARRRPCARGAGHLGRVRVTNTNSSASARWPDALNGKPLLIRASRSRGSWAPAEAAPLSEQKIRVVTVGPNPAQVQLRVDDSATWRVLAERLATVGEEDHPVRLESADWMIGLGSPKVAHDADPGRWVANWPSLKLNSCQR